jgi:methylated-DNA-[protein]-cysteine S-methyltransferase
MRTLLAKHYATFTTAAGICAIAWNGDGISSFQLGTSKPEDIEIWRKRRVPNAVQTSPDADILRVIDGAIRYFDGEAIDFTSAAVDLRGQPEFFVEIYAALRRVPYGKTTTYGELAKSVGAGRERSREVGVAMATNPAPLIVPCHRVLAAGGRLGGFSAPGGTEAKLRMLRLEGVSVESAKKSSILPVTQTSFVF